MYPIDTILVTNKNETVIVIGITERGNYAVMPQAKSGKFWLAFESFEISPLQIRRVIS